MKLPESFYECCLLSLFLTIWKFIKKIDNLSKEDNLDKIHPSLLSYNYLLI